MDFITSLFESPYFCALFAFPGSILFAMSLKAPKRSLLMSGIGGFVGQFIYVLFCSFTSIYLSVFIATFIACLLSEISSRIFKIPSTVVTYPALVPLVPGLMLYNAMLTNIMESDSYTADGNTYRVNKDETFLSINQGIYYNTGVLP